MEKYKDIFDDIIAGQLVYLSTGQGVPHTAFLSRAAASDALIAFYVTFLLLLTSRLLSPPRYNRE